MLYFYNMSSLAKEEAVFKALADARRRRMLDLLKERPRTTGDLCARFRGLDRCTVMQHLGVLERAGLVIVKRRGRERWNYLDVAPIQAVYERWISRYAVHAAGMLARLKADLEAEPDQARQAG